jgi:SAM-dependent methyltransferase
VRRLLRRLVGPRRRAALRLGVRRVRHLGWRRYCPVCRARCRAFARDARTARPDAVCPVCGSMERHRSIWPFLLGETPLARAPLRMLHVAPEGCFQRRLERFANLDYVSADLRRPNAMVHCDLTDLAFEDAEFDFVLCNHVLEHVPDDAAAMREMLRVLRPGGIAVLTVPGPNPALGYPEDLDETAEDLSIGSDAERLRRYGHSGHVRQYGRDIAARLRAAGFRVKAVRYGAHLSPAERRRQGVYEAYPIYLCERP